MNYPHKDNGEYLREREREREGETGMKRRLISISALFRHFFSLQLESFEKAEKKGFLTVCSSIIVYTYHCF